MSHPLKISLHVSGRTKPYSHMYFRMCARALVQYRKLSDTLKELNELDPCYDELSDAVEEAAVLPVVFAGMCLEATLFDLAACLFGEAFAESTERLDPLGKFVVLAQCVDKQSPSKSGATYQSLHALVTARNRLVHYKSQSMIDQENIGKFMERASKLHKQHLLGIDASFRALVLLSIHFDGNIFEELRILPSFKKPEYWNSLVPEELHAEVHRCIEIGADARKACSSQTAP